MTDRLEKYRMVLIALLASMILGLQPVAATGVPQAGDAQTDLDIVSYRIDAELQPAANSLKATSVVTFQLVKPAQSAVLELNGSLRVSAVKGADGKPLQFLQDTLDQYTVKVDLGRLVPAGEPTTLTFEYAGQLTSPEGGPLPDRRLAYVGEDMAYLHYAARWFPFHNYGADRATAEIRLTMPSNWKLAAHSDAPLVASPGAAPGTSVYTISRTTPVLPGTLAAGPYLVVPIQNAGLTVEYYALPGSEGTATRFAEETAQILAFYQKTFGPYPFGSRYVAAQVDDESLPMLAGSGIGFLSNETLRRGGEVPTADLAREIALQWWGQGVGLRDFDQVWLSSGLAQYSALLYQESQMTDSAFAAVLAELSERALAYESEVSIAQAPSQLNDQTPAFRSIVFYKGAYVFHMLRNLIGDQKFFAFMRDHYARNRGRNVSIADFERAATAAVGQDLRWFFGLWVESTGVPEFSWDYTVLRQADGTWRIRGTLKQPIEGFRMPVDVLVTSPGGGEERVRLEFNGKTADFNVATKGQQPSVTVDPERRLLRVSDTIRVAVVVRRGIQEMQRESYMDAESRFREAIKLAPRSSWAWYNLGLLYMKQKNHQKAIEAFTQAENGDLDPSWVEIWSLIFRGNAYDALGQRERAVAEYQKAVENGTDYDGSQEAAQRYLAEAYKPTEPASAKSTK